MKTIKLTKYKRKTRNGIRHLLGEAAAKKYKKHYSCRTCKQLTLTCRSYHYWSLVLEMLEQLSLRKASKVR